MSNLRNIGKFLLVFVLAFSLSLSGTVVEATSTGLDLSGDWRVFTDDGRYIDFLLQQKGSDVTGKYVEIYGNKEYNVPIKGTISGNKLRLYLTYDTPELVKASAAGSIPDTVAKKAAGIRSLLAFNFVDSEDEATGERLGWYIEWSGNTVKKYDGGTDYARQKNPPAKHTLTRVFESADVILDGEYLNFDQPAIIKNNSTLVPLRTIFEELGATIEWNATEKSVLAVKDDRSFNIKIGETTATINGETVQLSTPAQIIGGRTLVPLRFVSEALGAKVSWDGANKTVFISGE